MKQLLIIGTTWPEPKATAAGGRMQRLITFFLEEGYQVTFASTAGESKLSMDMEGLGVRKRNIRLNHSSFDALIKDLQPDIVLFDRYPMEEQFGWRVAEFAPHAVRILDTEDLHSVRKTREAAFKKDIPWDTDYWLQADSTKREIASIYRSDISLIISSYEMNLLRNSVQMDASLLLYLPFMLDKLTKKEIETWPSFDERQGFLCIGNGKHSPNVDAIKWLKTEIWPMIREAMPQANLNVYGAYLPEFFAQMHNPKEGFLVHGWAANKEEVFQECRINLAPLRFGAGIKGKLIDAMQAGTPSITTRIGAEGMHAHLEWNGTIADDPHQFAKAAVDLYQDKGLWSNAQRNGIGIVNTLHNKENSHVRFREKLEVLKPNLKAHRTQNLIGAMLQQQTTAATKYMAKWIALKNKI